MLLCRSQLATAATLPSSSSLTLWESSDVTAAANSLSLFLGANWFHFPKRSTFGGNFRTPPQPTQALKIRRIHIWEQPGCSLSRESYQSKGTVSCTGPHKILNTKRAREGIYPGFEPNSRDLFLKSPASKVQISSKSLCMPLCNHSPITTTYPHCFRIHIIQVATKCQQLLN